MAALEDDERDILARWMAHYVADLIAAAEAATGAKKEAAERRCMEAIIEVWKQRASFPAHARPFLPMDRIIDMLGALDPEAPQSFYRREVLRQLDDEEKSNDKAATWLRLALNVDQVARQLIDYGLARAAALAATATLPWVRAASEAEQADGTDVKFAILLANQSKQAWLREHDRKILENRIATLKQFGEFSRMLEAEYEEELQALAAPENKVEDEKSASLPDAGR